MVDFIAEIAVRFYFGYLRLRSFITPRVTFYAFLMFCTLLTLRFFWSLFVWLFAVEIVMPKELDYDFYKIYPDNKSRYHLPTRTIIDSGLSKVFVIGANQNIINILHSLSIKQSQIDNLISFQKNKNIELLSKVYEGQRLYIDYQCVSKYTPSYNLDVDDRGDVAVFPVNHDAKKDCLMSKIKLETKDDRELVINFDNHVVSEYYIAKLDRVIDVIKNSGTITNSLYYDAVSAGVPPGVIHQILSEYSFDIDFSVILEWGINLCLYMRWLGIKVVIRLGTVNCCIATWCCKTFLMCFTILMDLFMVRMGKGLERPF